MGGSGNIICLFSVHADRADVCLDDHKYLIFVGFGDRFPLPEMV